MALGGRVRMGWWHWQRDSENRVVAPVRGQRGQTHMSPSLSVPPMTHMSPAVPRGRVRSKAYSRWTPWWPGTVMAASGGDFPGCPSCASSTPAPSGHSSVPQVGHGTCGGSPGPPMGVTAAGTETRQCPGSGHQPSPTGPQRCHHGQTKCHPIVTTNLSLRFPKTTQRCHHVQPLVVPQPPSCGGHGCWERVPTPGSSPEGYGCRQGGPTPSVSTQGT